MTDKPAPSPAPRVSVLVPCFNAAEFLADALSSVAEQTETDFECIVVDDASTDATVDIARRFASMDSRFRLVELPENCGAASARNVGLAEASGHWVGVLDADDCFMPDRLQRMTDIGDRTDADIVIDEQIVTTYPARAWTHRAFAFRGEATPFTQEEYFTRSRLFTRALAIGYMKPLIRRAFLRRTRASYEPDVPSGEDFVFYASLFATRPRCVTTSYSGYVYRRRRGSLSGSETHLHVHAGLSDRILDAHGDRLSVASSRALARRKRDFESLAAAQSALAALRGRRWRHLARSLLNSPAVTVTGLRLLKRRVMRVLPWSGAAPARAKNFR